MLNQPKSHLSWSGVWKRAAAPLCLLSVLLAACVAAPPLTPPASPAPPTASATPSITPSVTVSPTAEPSPTFTLTPAPLVIRFAVIGDFGADNAGEAAVANLIHSWSPDLILTVGDNNYPRGGAETIDANIGKYFHQYIFPYSGAYGPGAETNRFFPTLGNHDWMSRNAQPYLEYFTLPGNERYYEFVWPPVHFFALNSDEHEPDGVGVSSAQAQWLRERLASSVLPWQVVYFHHAPYSSGAHGSTLWMRWPFAAWGADAVLAGHDHIYERLLVDGIPYFINGLGGGGRYNLAVPLPESQVRFNDDYGAMLVTADERTMTFAFYTREGILIDSFQISRP